MTIELRIVSGARAGQRARFDRSPVTMGRHPLSDLQFDPDADLDVSTRHAELRETDGAWTVIDQQSTNGTFVNGERIAGQRRLSTGDTLGLGENGPQLEVRIADAPRATVASAGADAAPRRDTGVRIAEAVKTETASLRRMLALALGSLVVVALVAGALWQRRTSARERDAQVTPPRATSTQMDLPRVHALNDAAVAMIASDLDGTFVAATGFSISSDGLLVTNRHIVRTADNRAPRRIRVLFANTTGWRSARLVRASETDDLALLQVEEGGPFPVVAGVSRAAPDARVGTPVATIGYPHAVDTPMEGAGLDVRARTTTTAGTIGKRLDDVLQIDSYAGKGSSGSPVFDARGNVVGVVYGGAAESGGRIVYAVPAERLAAFLTAAGVMSILR